MKKARKLLVALLVLTFVMSTFSVGFAADEAEKLPADVVRAQALGILKGDDQGRLNLDKPITRAEALALIVRISGLEKSADLMSGQTQFADANVDPSLQWATGYINLGVGQNIINGYPDGTFKGNAEVTFAEMAKMLLYAMNYGVTVEGGQWPAAVMGKADDLKVFDKVNALPNIPALRGDVVKMIDNSLTVKHLKQIGFGDFKQYEEGDDTFLTKMKVEEKDGLIVTAIPRIDDKLKDNEIKLDSKKYKVLADVDFEELFGQEVTVFMNDDDEIVNIEIDSEFHYDALKDVDTKKMKLKLADAGDKYDIAEDVTVYINAEKEDIEDLEEKYDYAKIVLNDDGEVVFVDAYEWDDCLIVEEVEKDVVYAYGEELDIEDFVIVKDGKAIDADDIEEGDILFYNNKAEFAEIYNDSIEGEIERIYSDSIKVNGKEYDIDGVKYIDEDDEVREFAEEIAGSYKDIVEAMQDAGEVAVFLNRAGDMVFLSGDVSDLETSSDYVYVHFASTKLTDSRYSNDEYYALDVVNADGKLVKYDIDAADVEDIIVGADTWEDANLEGKVVELSLDKDGEVDKILILDEVEIDKDNGEENSDKVGAVKVSAKYVAGNRVNSDATVFLTEDYEGKAKDIDVKFLNDLDFEKILAGTAYVKGDKVVAFDVTESDAGEGDKHLTVATANGKKVSGKKIYNLSLIIDGKKVRVDTKSGIEAGDSAANVKKGDLLEVTFDKKNEVIAEVVKITGDRVVEGTISEIKTSSKSFKVNGNPYKLGADAVIVDSTDSYKILSSLSNLKNGDNVKILLIKKDSVYAEVVVKLDKDEAPVVSGDIEFELSSDYKAITVSNLVYGDDNEYIVKISGDALNVAVYSDPDNLQDEDDDDVVLSIDGYIPANGVYKVELINTVNYNKVIATEEMFLRKNNQVQEP